MVQLTVLHEQDVTAHGRSGFEECARSVRIGDVRPAAAAKDCRRMTGKFRPMHPGMATRVFPHPLGGIWGRSGSCDHRLCTVSESAQLDSEGVPEGGAYANLCRGVRQSDLPPAAQATAPLMGEVFAWAFLAALNPTLLAATTVMLLLDHPGRLMLGYWLGAMFCSVTLGLVIVFALEGPSTVNTTKNTLSPIADFVLAAICLILAGVLARGLNQDAEERHQSRRAKHGHENKTPKWQQQLSKGTARTTFVIGALLSLPGASYLVGLNNIHKLHYSTTVTVLLVIGFNLVQLLLIEIPMIAFRIAPTQTPIAIEHTKQWALTHWRICAVWGLLIIGGALAIKGIIEAV
jgi:hypothetical protein